MMEKIISLIKDNSVNIPKTLLYNYKTLKLSEKELIILIYIINKNNYKFDPKEISSKLGFNVTEILEIIDSLSTKDLIKIELIKSNNIREEFINLDNLYNKLAYIIINDETIKEKEDTSSNLFDVFEKELGRTLSPMEYEIINGWRDASFEEETIILALKEATYNGVSNLRYIDKILYEWKKKGIKTLEDVENDRNNFQNKKIEKKELFDYDWLNDD